MPRIKITGFFDVKELPDDYVDLDSPQGLTPRGEDAMFEEFELEELTFELLDD